MNKSEIAEKIVEYVRRNHNSRSDELMKLIAEYDVERAIAESQPNTTIQILGYCLTAHNLDSDERTQRPHIHNGLTCRNWKPELGDGEPSPAQFTGKDGHKSVGGNYGDSQADGARSDSTSGIGSIRDGRDDGSFDGEGVQRPMPSAEKIERSEIESEGKPSIIYAGRLGWQAKSGAAQEVSPSANFVSEIRPRPDDPSCHVCGARMAVKEWKCLSCKATTGVEEVSPPSPSLNLPNDTPYPLADEAEGDTRELKAALKLGLKLIKSANRKRDQPWWDDALAFTVETERLLG